MNRKKQVRKGVLMLCAALTFFLLLIGCASLYKTSGGKWNLAAIYNPISSKLHPAYSVYHHMDDRSLLLVKLFPSELLFNQASQTGEFMSKVSVELQVFEIRDKDAIFAAGIL